MARFKAFSATLIMLVVCLFLVNFASAITWDNVAYWKLDEVSGTVIDATHFYNATNNGANTNVAGKINTAYNFTGDGATFGVETPAINITQNLSISFWTKPTWENSDASTFISKGEGTSVWGIRQYGATNDINFIVGGCSIRTTGYNLIDGSWWLVTATQDHLGNLSIYLNGTLVNSTTSACTTISSSPSGIFIGEDNSSFHRDIGGLMDEIGIWNRTLTAADVTELYNSGAGKQFSLISGPIITLESITNDTTISDIGTDFRVSGNDISSLNFNWTNVTYYVWNASTIHNTTFVDLSSNSSTFNHTLEIDAFVLADYEWNAYACWENTTFSNCTWAASNFTFNVVPTSTLSEKYINTTIEGSTDTFDINLSVISGLRMSTITFTYNNTEIEADFTEYETDKYYASINQDIPLVSADVNITFYWTITLESGFSQNTTMHNQTVKNLVIDNCASGTFYLFNFSMLDEDDLSFLTGTTYNTSMKVDLTLARLDTSDLDITYSHLYTKTNPALVCSNVDLDGSQFKVNALIEYVAANRFIEFYNIQNYLLTNTTDHQNITLYNLNSSLGQAFKITYKDSNFNLVPGAVIQIQRKYIDEGLFRTIEIPKISSAGYTIAHLIRSDVVYNLVVLKDGVVLDSFTNIVADCQNPTISECVININSFSSAVQPENFDNSGGFSNALTYNSTTRVINSVFAITSGVASLTTLNVTLFDYRGNTSVCSDSLNAAGGTLTCTIPAKYANATVIVEVWNNGELKRRSIIKLGDQRNQVYGNSLIFMSLCIILLVIGMSITDNPMILGIMLIFGTGLLMVLNMVNNSGWIGAGSTILWLIVAIVIVIIKGGNRQ